MLPINEGRHLPSRCQVTATQQLISEHLLCLSHHIQLVPQANDLLPEVSHKFIHSSSSHSHCHCLTSGFLTSLGYFKLQLPNWSLHLCIRFLPQFNPLPIGPTWVVTQRCYTDRNLADILDFQKIQMASHKSTLFNLSKCVNTIHKIPLFYFLIFTSHVLFILLLLTWFSEICKGVVFLH